MSCVDLLPVETHQDRNEKTIGMVRMMVTKSLPTHGLRGCRDRKQDLGIAPTASSKASLTALRLKSTSLGVYCHPTTYVTLPVPAVPAPDHLILLTVAHSQDDSVPTAISYDVIRQDTVPDYRNFLGNPTLLVKEVFPDEVGSASVMLTIYQLSDSHLQPTRVTVTTGLRILSNYEEPAAAFKELCKLPIPIEMVFSFGHEWSGICTGRAGEGWYDESEVSIAAGGHLVGSMYTYNKRLMILSYE
ncbi:hypothetical protein B0H14DRAFT_2600043 [Mycena olivaceomarginata]|nr:hypothetical protein B0H14DRAFT_2600043 [Mycena olivaceomarginata]